VDFTIKRTLSLGTDKVFYSFKIATCESTPNAPNQEIKGMNHGICRVALQEEAQ